MRRARIGSGRVANMVVGGDVCGVEGTGGNLSAGYAL